MTTSQASQHQPLLPFLVGACAIAFAFSFEPFLVFLLAGCLSIPFAIGSWWRGHKADRHELNATEAGLMTLRKDMEALELKLSDVSSRARTKAGATQTQEEDAITGLVGQPPAENDASPRNREESIVRVGITGKGVSVVLVEWNFDTMTADAFKKRFKKLIHEPLRDLLQRFNHNPSSQIPSLLKLALEGLIRGLARHYENILSRSDHQILLDVHSLFAPVGQVCYIRFQSIGKIRKCCLSILDRDRRKQPFAMLRKSTKEMQSFLARPTFVSQRITLQNGDLPEVSFPLLVCWTIAELGPRRCQDKFCAAEIVLLKDQKELRKMKTAPAEMEKTPKEKFFAALCAHEDLIPYANETCAFCESSGIMKLSGKCSGCEVAPYCNRQHHKEHWHVHKNHCKYLRDIAEVTGYLPE